jgi:AraC-like DNA-binding protein
MSEAYAFHEGPFGQAIVLESRTNLVAHSHTESQVAFWLGGARARAQVGKDVVHYAEDVGVATNAYQLHDMTLLEQNGTAVFLLLMISRDWLNEQRRTTGRPFLFPCPRIPIDDTLRKACWRLLNLLMTNSGNRALIDAEAESLIGASVAAATGSRDAAAVRMLPPLLDHRLRAAISLMRDHVGGSIGVEEIAEKVGMSRAHFFMLFKEQLNTTPQVFWSALRVEEAMRRLISPKATLTDVAFDLGFSAPSNFSRFFKEHIGVSPSTFRRAAIGQSAAPQMTN